MTINKYKWFFSFKFKYIVLLTRKQNRKQYLRFNENQNKAVMKNKNNNQDVEYCFSIVFKLILLVLKILIDKIERNKQTSCNKTNLSFIKI